MRTEDLFFKLDKSKIKTDYRVVTRGGVDYLQYKTYRRFLWFFKIPKWEYIPLPFWHPVFGRKADPKGQKTLVCSLNTGLRAFVRDTPDIEEYLNKTSKRQRQLQSLDKEAPWKIDWKPEETHDYKYTWNVIEAASELLGEGINEKDEMKCSAASKEILVMLDKHKE